MALYATCMPLPSDTFHDKLIPCPCDMGDDADYVMMMMMMTTRRDCGSVCNLYASAV